MTPRVDRFLFLLLLISISVNPNECRKSQRPRPASRFSEPTEPQPTQDAQFDWQLIKYMLRQDSRNVAFSTFSAKFLLNMLYEGTSIYSATQQELNEPLKRSPDIHETPKCVTIMNTLTKNAEQFLVSSRVFADSMVAVSQKYATILDMQYNASIDNVSFQEPEIAANTINSWVSNSTRGMIPKMVRAQNIRDSVLLLLNAIYFKGLWVNVFLPSATSIQPFRTASGQTVQVPFMKQIQDHYYADSKELNAQLVRLPYADGRFSMIVVLPNVNSNLNELLNALTSESINEAIRSMDETEVNLQLPRFQIDYDCSLKSGLQQLGINRIFQDNAELGLIFRGGPVPAKVSDVLQKTVIVVDEKGSTASSASGSSLVFTIASEPELFIVNRPFMFFIEEESTGAVVFAGKVENPAQ
ncbi:AAEL005665-PA, partial [Aedes aegypti]|uniref:Serpin domain-containing protein n=3 Tax=Aedes aegypti TaxID=7159 RepID=Q179D9_AEDAE